MNFNTIPVDLLTPGQYVEFSNERAVRGLPGMPSRILVLGQKLAAGSQVVNLPVRVQSADEAAALFGRGSMLHAMVQVIRENNRWTELWAVALADDAAGVAAAGAVKVDAPATAAGTLAIYIDGQRIRVGIAAGATAAQIATAIAAAINALPDLPVAAAVDGVDTAKVNITCRWKGETGNDLDIRVNYHQGEVLPAGLQLTITAMAGGTANPDIAPALAAIAADWYTDVAMPYTDAANLSAIEAEVDARAGGTVQMDMAVYAGARGTLGALSTLGDSRNSFAGPIIGAKGSPSAPWRWAAAIAAVAAFEANQDPARPYQTLVLKSILAPASADRFSLEERNLLLKDGIATFTVDVAGLVRIERLVTTYKTNAYGLADTSYLDLETLKTLAYLRYTVRARISQRFPRHKLAGDDVPVAAGAAIATPSAIRNELISLAGQWVQAALVEGIEQFKTDLVVERDADDPNRVNVLLPPDLVNQLRVFAAKIEFRV